MATIKKAFQPIMSLLAANMSATVEDIYPQVEELAAAKTGAGGSQATSFHKNDEGVVVGIRCSYFKQWFDPSVVEFGKKLSAASGYNPMCKEAVSNWTKQQAAFKKGKEELLNDVAKGEVDASDIDSTIAELEKERTATAETELVGYETLEELLAAS